MPATPGSMRQKITREIALFIGLLFVGIVLLPIAVWLIGDAVFGDHAGSGYTGFFSPLSAKIREGNAVAWFFVLSPYLAFSVVRLAVWGWRQTGKP